MSKHTPFSPPTDSFWLFAYGSLMWQTDFPFKEQHLATIYGYHRALCIYSWTYRGTEQNPGLVFGLDEDGTTQGIVFQISAKDAVEVYDKIHAREMVSNVYQPQWVSCHLDDGADATVQALAYVADHSNQQYAGALSDDDIVKLVHAGHGIAGPCTDYVLNTDKHLREISVCDPMLERIAGKLNTKP